MAENDKNAGGAGGAGGSSDSNNQGAAGTGAAGTGASSSGSGEGQGLTFEGWYQKQDESMRGMIDGHVRGLKTSLDSERGARKDLEKQLRDLAGKAEKGSEAEKKLTEMADNMSASERRSDFYEQAHNEGVTNLKLAFLVAQDEELIDSKGRVNFVEMRKKFPELFGGGKKSAPANAGAGTGGAMPNKSMNDFIRAAAGRK